MPHAAFEWQTVPAVHDPLVAPPHVPRPQSVFAWQVTLLHLPPPHVPLPHCALVVHAIGVHAIAAQVPPLQSASPAHSHALFTHARPVPQVLFEVHAVWLHVPVVAPVHANDPFGQLGVVPHGSSHWPIAPGVAPWQVAEKPQSTLSMHWLVVPISALAETWKSLKTTRPHCAFDAAPRGVLNVKRLV